MKQTYIIILELDTQIADEYNKLAADYENLSPQEHQNFSLLSDAILYGNSMLQLKPMTDTSIISWLPVDGTVPPDKGNSYLVRDSWGLVYMSYCKTGGELVNANEKAIITHYADMPTFTPGANIPDRQTGDNKNENQQQRVRHSAIRQPD